jgi:hypothetical protein
MSFRCKIGLHSRIQTTPWRHYVWAESPLDPDREEFVSQCEWRCQRCGLATTRTQAYEIGFHWIGDDPGRYLTSEPGRLVTSPWGVTAGI